MIYKKSERVSILPKWIKAFILFFILIGLLAILSIILGVLGFKSGLALYGLETQEPLSVTGRTIIFLALFKSVISYFLWIGEKTVFDYAIADAIIGIAICVFTGFISPLIFSSYHVNLELRLELLILIPYLLFLIRNREKWIQFED